MQLTKEQLSPTKVKVTVTADAAEIQSVKEHVIGHLSKNVKVPGFRPGKAPSNLIEKNVDQAVLQSQVLDELINKLYFDAVSQEKLRPIAQPSVNLTKFVPYTDLEFTAEVEVVGDVQLPDYTKIKVARKPVSVTDKDVTDVIENIRQRSAGKKAVDRDAKDGDELVIDFTGVDAESGEPISGADGKEYPLVLGSKTFIPGFEEELLGAKPGAVKTFDIVFPDDYGVPALQKKKVTFTVTVHSVSELELPKLDDEFAKNAGPFQSLADLKSDIKQQLTAERQRETDMAYINAFLEKVAAKTETAIPDGLVEEEIDRMEAEEKRNLTYRGQTWEEHLAEEGITAEEHRARQRPDAAQRLKNSLILGEIAEKENITVTPEELEVRIQLLKGQYADPAMQAELEKPESRREIHSRMVTDKTYDKILSYAA
jgi:trigger factor